MYIYTYQYIYIHVLRKWCNVILYKPIPFYVVLCTCLTYNSEYGASINYFKRVNDLMQITHF